MFYIRNKLLTVTKNIMNRIFNLIIPLVTHILKIKTIFKKSVGVLTTALYTAFGMLMAIKSALGAFATLLIIALVAFAAAIVILWIMPWTWGLAIPATAFCYIG